MLKESSQNTDMDEDKKTRLTIHRSNLFHPSVFGISHLDWHRDISSLAVVKESASLRELAHYVNFIEIYRSNPPRPPKIAQTIIEYERITGISWIAHDTILAVTRDQTINLYSTKLVKKIFSIVADYGPITCMKYFYSEKLLLIGTQYGYVAAYKIEAKKNNVEFISKMVKINDQIEFIDAILRRKDKKDLKTEATPAQIPDPAIRPGKRKRQNDSDDESSDDEETGASNDEEFLSNYELTIYGASQGNIVIWNYHSKTIIETMHVCDEPELVLSLLALKNGDVISGDSTGLISVFDHNSWTCRQSIKASESSILSLAMNKSETHLLASGKDPTLVILKKGVIDTDALVLFEKNQSHTHEVSSIVFKDDKEFFTGSYDGLIVTHKIRRKSKKMFKQVTFPEYKHCINFARSEMMVQQDRTLVIWKLPDTVFEEPDDIFLLISDQPPPIKHLLLKTRAFIHSSTFSDKWIVYTTQKGLYIMNRQCKKLESGKSSKKVPVCDMLQICLNNRYLIGGTGKCLIGIDLETVEQDSEGSSKCFKKYKVKDELTLKSTIKQMVFMETKNLLLVACNQPRGIIYVFKLNTEQKSKRIIKRLYKIIVNGGEMSFLASNSKLRDEGKIFIYTTHGKIALLDISTKSDKKDMVLTIESKAVSGLPDDATIVGMLPFSQDQCILYNNDHLFKVDIVSNKVLSTNTDYKNIMKMEFLFDRLDQVALVELTPDDYMKLLPVLLQQKKFGCK